MTSRENIQRTNTHPLKVINLYQCKLYITFLAVTSLRYLQPHGFICVDLFELFYNSSFSTEYIRILPTLIFNDFDHCMSKRQDSAMIYSAENHELEGLDYRDFNIKKNKSQWPWVNDLWRNFLYMNALSILESVVSSLCIDLLWVLQHLITRSQ